MKALTGLVFVTGLAGAQDTLWINASTWTPQGQPVPAIRLNASSEFALRNARVERPADEAASMVLVNLDDAAHVAAVWADEGLANVEVGEGITFRLFADQTGIYPVHDHNLIAVTNAGLYPGGMLTQIYVTP